MRWYGGNNDLVIIIYIIIYSYIYTYICVCVCVYIYIYEKPLKRVFPFTRPMRGVLGEGGRWGGPQGGGPSWRSWQMSLPPLQMHPSRSPHEEQGQ